MKIEDYINQINDSEIPNAHFLDDVIDIDGWEKVAEVDPHERRWYIISTIVYKVGDRFIGVRGPTTLKSEEMCYADVCFPCEAFEMKQVPTYTYVKKEEVK